MPKKQAVAQTAESSIGVLMVAVLDSLMEKMQAHRSVAVEQADCPELLAQQL